MRLQRRRRALTDVAIFTRDVRGPHTDDPEIAECADYLVRPLAWLTIDGLAAEPAPVIRGWRSVQAARSLKEQVLPPSPIAVDGARTVHTEHRCGVGSRRGPRRDREEPSQ